jgi:inorganic pyrophosphatase
MSFEIEEVGNKNTDSYRLFFKRNIDDKKHYISPFHDISLYTSTPGIYHMVVEIPRWSNAKLEICKSEPYNPIKQDTKQGKLRFVDNCFPYHGYIWNYGALPQTWEMPSFMHPGIECKGDNDPVDVIEIGSKIHPAGSVVEVKILGGLAMIDEGELDWKMIGIDVNDPLAEKLNDLSDLKIYTPGLLKATLDWFRIYKVPTGAKPNQFAFNEQFQDRESAIDVINLTHTLWKRLINNDVDENENDMKDFKMFNTDLNDGNVFKQTYEEAERIVESFTCKLVLNKSNDQNEANLQCEKVYYVNKKEIAKLSNVQNVKNESKVDGLYCRLNSFFKFENTPLLIPIGIAFFGYIIYAFYQF